MSLHLVSLVSLILHLCFPLPATTSAGTGGISTEQGLPYISRLQRVHLELPVFVGRSKEQDNHENKV
jgi:hypothetical protein